MLAHSQCRQDEWKSKHHRRLSFSRAALLDRWMPVQQIVYHMLWFFKTELTWSTDSTATYISGQNCVNTLHFSCFLSDQNSVKVKLYSVHKIASCNSLSVQHMTSIYLHIWLNISTVLLVTSSYDWVSWVSESSSRSVPGPQVAHWVLFGLTSRWHAIHQL